MKAAISADRTQIAHSGPPVRVHTCMPAAMHVAEYALSAHRMRESPAARRSTIPVCDPRYTTACGSGIGTPSGQKDQEAGRAYLGRGLAVGSVRSMARARVTRIVKPILWKMLRGWVSTVFWPKQFRGDLRVGLAVNDEPRYLEFALRRGRRACAADGSCRSPVRPVARSRQDSLDPARRGSLRAKRARRPSPRRAR